MRRKERIPEFLKLLNWEEFCKTYAIPTATFITEEMVEYWLENYDMRFGQMLINQGVVADGLSLWVKEEEEFLEEQGIATQDFLMWGQNYDVDGNRLPETKHALIKDMNTGHITAILNSFYIRLRPSYATAFISELKRRGEHWEYNPVSP